MPSECRELVCVCVCVCMHMCVSVSGWRWGGSFNGVARPNFQAIGCQLLFASEFGPPVGLEWVGDSRGGLRPGRWEGVREFVHGGFAQLQL